MYCDTIINNGQSHVISSLDAHAFLEDKGVKRADVNQYDVNVWFGHDA